MVYHRRSFQTKPVSGPNFATVLGSYVVSWGQILGPCTSISPATAYQLKTWNVQHDEFLSIEYRPTVENRDVYNFES